MRLRCCPKTVDEAIELLRGAPRAPTPEPTPEPTADAPVSAGGSCAPTAKGAPVSREQEALARIVTAMALDPLTLSRVRAPSTAFALCRCRTLTKYHAVTLVRYILHSADLTDPLARQPYERHELARLQRVTGLRFAPAELGAGPGTDGREALRAALLARRRLRTSLLTTPTVAPITPPASPPR